MTELTTKPIPGFFGEYFAVVSKADPARFVAVGVNPGQARANGKIALSLESERLRESHDLIRISEEQYRSALAATRA